MKETNYWKQFTMTGSVEDYLRYRSFTEKHSREESKTENERDGETHAGMRGSYGDRFENGTHRRI